MDIEYGLFSRQFIFVVMHNHIQCSSLTVGRVIAFKRFVYLNASTSSGVNGIFLPRRRAPVSVIR